MKKYDVASQLQYPNTPYRTKDGLPKGATIKSGGCGPSSCRNLLNNLLGVHYTIPQVAQIAVDCGARYNGGTDIRRLLTELQKRNDFKFRCVTKDSEALDAVNNGAMAIIHTPSGAAGNLFSSGGHFMCLADVTGGTGTIIDSCSYEGKWEQYNRPKYIKTTNQAGVIQCSTAKIAEAIDYYFIVEVDDMTEKDVRDIIAKVKQEESKRNVSAWASGYFAACKDAEILDGTAPQSAVTKEQLARVLVSAGVVNTAQNPSGWAVGDWNEAIVKGITDGSRPRAFITRQEAVAMIMRAFRNIGK